MKKIKIYIMSLFLEVVLFFVFRTNKWHVTGLDNLQRATKNKRPIMLCSWHARFLYAVYFFKKYKTPNLWAVSSTHEDSQIMAHFLSRSSIGLIRGSSTRGWDNVIKKMLAIFKKNNSIFSSLSGSGSTIFGVYENQSLANSVSESMQGLGYQSIVANPVYRN